MTLAKNLPAKLTLNPQLPELRGNSKSNFEYQLDVKNDSGKKLMVALSATAPQNFDATFTEQYGSQELNALPIDAGQSKDVKLKVRPPNTVAAGKYNVVAKASAEDATATSDLALDITGQPKLDISRPRRPAQRARVGRQRDLDPGHPDQHRHGAGRGGRTVRLRAERLEDRVRAQDDRPHRAEREQGSAGAGHADREGDRRRLRDDRPRRVARRIRVADRSASR